MTNLRACGIVVVAGVAMGQTAAAHSNANAELQALGKEIDALKAGQATIQKDLQEIRNLLRTPPGAAPTRTPAAVEPVLVVRRGPAIRSSVTCCSARSAMRRWVDR